MSVVQAVAVFCTACGVENQADARFCKGCGQPLEPPNERRDYRKTVTVIFCDVVGSTALGETTDPEALKGLLARYFERMRTIIELHGGTVQKFAGDAVMAVFGAPVAHDDDALRAVRAAAEMRAALPELGVEARIGVNSGEVMTVSEEWLVTGDAVNVAARLQQAAAPGDILLGTATRALAGAAVTVEELEPLELKGKSAPVAAFRLLSIGETPERPHESRFVGRDTEIALLRDAWDRAIEGRRCELVTVVGEPGVGKSRLVAELVRGLDARIVRGRCLSYGEGITYGPIVDVVKQLDAFPEEPAAAAAIRSLLGDDHVGASADEIAWGFRKLLEQSAPLVVVFDDIQWGEEAFLDLVEHVALLSTGAPLLLLCMARPEFTARRAQWPAALALAPLPPADVDSLLPSSLPPGLRERIARAAGGNPLFVTELLALSDGAGEEIVVPPTLKALLAARIDRLETAERGVLERGAVEGELFHRGAVQALSREEQVTPHLSALVRKELIRPDRPQLPSEDGFRFCHLLIRDAVYEALPKATRAELHERFADWLDHPGSALVELDEIVGYHLEQAYRYRQELGQDEEALAERAAEHLAAAGRRALGRTDPASINLLGRASELLRRPDWRLEIDLAAALRMRGRFEEAHELLGGAAARAVADGDRQAELHVLLAQLEPVGSQVYEVLAGGRALAEEALAVFEQAGDEVGLMRVWAAMDTIEQVGCRLGPSAEAARQALVYARAVGDQRVVLMMTSQLAGLGVWGPEPVDDVLRWIEALGPLRQTPIVMTGRAMCLAMRADLDDARLTLAEACARWHDLVGTENPGMLWCRYDIEMLAGDLVAAEQAIRRACELLGQQNERGHRSTQTGRLARVLCALGRYEEAEQCSQLSEELGTNDDVITEMLWRQTRATALAHRNEHTEAERLARESVALAQGTDMLNAHGDVLVDLAEVLELGGRTEDARRALEQAQSLYERKGNIVMAKRTQAQLSLVQ